MTQEAVAVGRRWEAASAEYSGRIRKMAASRFHSIPGFDQDDMESQLLEVLWLATVRYDPDNGANFQTFFNLLVNNRMRDLVRHAFREFRKADLFCERLDVDEVRMGIEQMFNEASAEEAFFAGVTVNEWFAAGEQEA